MFVFSWSPWTYNGLFRTQGLLSITDKRLITSSSCAKKKRKNEIKRNKKNKSKKEKKGTKNSREGRKRKNN